MTLKTGWQGVLDLAASLVAIAIASTPFVWLLTLPQEKFRELFQDIGLLEFRALEVALCVVWLAATILLLRLFERLLDRVLGRPPSPWLKR